MKIDPETWADLAREFTSLGTGLFDGGAYGRAAASSIEKLAAEQAARFAEAVKAYFENTDLGLDASLSLSGSEINISVFFDDSALGTRSLKDMFTEDLAYNLGDDPEYPAKCATALRTLADEIDAGYSPQKSG